MLKKRPMGQPRRPLASFDAWDAQPPAYAHIPPAPRYSSNDWLSNLLNFFTSPVLHRVGGRLLANVLFALLIYLLHLLPAVQAVAKLLNPVAHSLTGAVMGLLLVFRTNSSYSRFYDARCIWGQLVNTIREMSRLAHTNMRGLDREHALMLTAALPTLILNHLQSHNANYRSTQWSAAQKAALTDLLSEHDLKCIWAARNRPMAAAKMIGAVYRSWFSDVEALKRHFVRIEDGRELTGSENAVLAANVQAARLHMERQLEVISNCYGASERIVRSNVPASYSRHTSRFLSIWCFTLPLALVGSLQWVTVPVVALICWSLFIIEEVGHFVEDPFNAHMYIPPSEDGQEDMLIIEGSQGSLREDALDRNPGPATRVAAVPRYAGDELDYDVAEFHEEWKEAAASGAAAAERA
jgi:putative membrane protein